MSDTNTDVTEEADEVTEGTEEEELDLDRAKAKIAKSNREAANLRKRLKAAEAAEAKLKALEDAEKTETQRLTEQLEAANRELAKAALEQLRRDVAEAKGLTKEQAKRLNGSTQEELEADAEELLTVFDTGKTRKTAPTRLRGGANPANEDVAFDPAKVAQNVLTRKYF